MIPINALTFGEMETTIEEEEAFANMTIQEQFDSTIRQKQIVVIYHANCVDGFTAAWVFKKASELLGTPFEFHKGVYGETPPDVSEAIVYLVDFSYKRQVVKDMIQLGGALQVVLIDHHISAIKDLEGLNEELASEGFEEAYFVNTNLEKSGAMLAWEFWEELFQEHNVDKPLLLDNIQDRDLWNFKLPLTEELSAAIFSYEYTFENWDKLMSGNIVDNIALAASGKALLRKHSKDVKELLAVTESVVIIDGYEVPCANLPYIFASDAGHVMASRPENTARFAATYYDSPTHRVFSLRSAKDTGMDVSVIAAKYGGGGHKNAAGFKLTLCEGYYTDIYRTQSEV